MARVDQYEFGRIVVDGRQETRDLIIRPAGWWGTGGAKTATRWSSMTLPRFWTSFPCSWCGDRRRWPQTARSRRGPPAPGARGARGGAATGQAVRRYAELVAGHPAGMLGRGMALELPGPDDPHPAALDRAALFSHGSPERGGRGALAGWPGGWPGSGRTQHREQGGRVYLHLGARHESPQRQPADGVAEVDSDQEAALRRLSLAILLGTPTRPSSWPAHHRPDVATRPLFGPVAPQPMGHPALPTPLRPLNPGPCRSGSRHGKGAERDARGHLGGLPARRPATGT